MKSNYYASSVCSVFFLSLVMIILVLVLPAAADDCFKAITFKNDGAYEATAGVSFLFNGQNVSKPTGNFMSKQQKHLSVPCGAIQVRAWAKALPGNDIFTLNLGTAADKCFVLQGSRSNPAYAECPACYKTMTFKNEGGYIANCTVKYKLNGNPFEAKTDNFNRGQQRYVQIPCEATDVLPIPHAVSSIYGFDHGYTFYKAEDRCFVLKGTTGDPDWQSCDPPGTPPIYNNHCWKEVTIKNESAYSAWGDAHYSVDGERAKVSQYYKIGWFSHGQIKRFPVPCAAGSHIRIAAFEADYFLNMNLSRNQDHCFILRGTQTSPRYELCAVGGQTHAISIRNYGAYSTELSVAYDYNGMRMNPKDMIHAGQRGGMNIPVQATNVHIRAKAVGGETIISTTIPAARTICWEVRGSTLNTRSNFCPP